MDINFKGVPHIPPIEATGRYFVPDPIVSYSVIIDRTLPFPKVILKVYHSPRNKQIPQLSNMSSDEIFIQSKKGNISDVFDRVKDELLIGNRIHVSETRKETTVDEIQKYETIKPLFLQTVQEILPYLNDPKIYHWEKICDSIITSLSRASVNLQKDILDLFLGMIYQLIDFSSTVFAVKWQLGLGRCANDPDPNNISYPRTSSEWRATWEWETNIKPQIHDQIRAELNFAKMPQWTEAYNKFTKRTGKKIRIKRYKDIFGQVYAVFDMDDDVRPKYFEILLPVESQLIQEEMRERKITFKSFYEENKDKFPPPGKYTSLAEVLIDRWGDIEKTSRNELISYASPILSNIWLEYYGFKALQEDLERKYRAFVKKSKDLLEKVSYEREKLTYGEIYEIYRMVEIDIHKFIREKLVQAHGVKENEWWVRGVSENIRIKCQKRREQDYERFEPYKYTDPIDLKEIIYKNWNSIFKNYFEKATPRKMSKNEYLSILERLNDIRRLVMHPIRRPLGDEEIQFIKKCYNLIQTIRAHSID